MERRNGNVTDLPPEDARAVQRLLNDIDAVPEADPQRIEPDPYYIISTKLMAIGEELARANETWDRDVQQYDDSQDIEHRLQRLWFDIGHLSFDYRSNKLTGYRASEPHLRAQTKGGA